MNAHRASYGVAPLLLDDKLSGSAVCHSEDMAEFDFFDHNSMLLQRRPPLQQAPTSTRYNPFQRMEVAGYTYYTAKAENICAGYQTAADAFNGFKNSPGHNAAMLNPDLKVVGIGFVVDPTSPYRYYWTVDFGGYVDSSAHGSGFYQQTDPLITYLGTWDTRWDSRASVNTFLFASAQGAAARMRFTGTSVQLFAKTGPVYGNMTVTIDAGTSQARTEDVDLYSSGEVFKVPVLTQGAGLTAGEHTLTIECLGTKEPASGGTVVDIDAVRIMNGETAPGALLQTQALYRHQENDPLVTYTGGWGSVSSWLLSAGSFKYADSPGASVNVKFNGDYLAWVAKTGPGYGKARVVLDYGTENEVTSTVDLYSSYDKYKQKVYDTGLLEEGEHTVSIYWIGEKNSRAYGYRINADTFDATGELLEAPAAQPIALLYQQTDSRIVYSGAWSTRWDSRASGGNFRYTTTPGAAALVSLKGTQVELWAKKGSIYGKMQVTLSTAGGDLIKTDTVDLYSVAEEFKAKVWDSTGYELDPTQTYLLTVECLREKNPASGGTVVDIDALNLTGTPVSANRVQEADLPEGPISGVWSTSGTNWVYSAGAFKFSNCTSPGSVTVNFEGAYLAWVTKTSPQYGIARS